ncbi:hypothetical protein V1264_001319 [Littorina saxatilis]|uniref:TIR domain-containing protein n=3 Tax=Littorina saxatilis TaxID=31220 RepID=A0AAN9C162_9CAEN
MSRMAELRGGARYGVERQRQAAEKERQKVRDSLTPFPHSFQLEDYDQLSEATLKSIKNHLEAALKAGYPTVLQEVRTRNLLAFLLCRLKECKEALRQLDQALTLEDKNLVSLANKAVVLSTMQRDREAKDQVQRLLDLLTHTEKSDFSYLHLKAQAELANSYLRFGHRYIGLAIQSFLGVLPAAKEPELSMWKFGLAVAYRQSLHLQCLPYLPDETETNRHMEAMKLLLEVVGSTSDNPNLTANAHAEIGLLISATWDDKTKQQLCTLAKTSPVKSVKKAFELDKEDPSVLLKRGRLFRYARNLRESLSSLKESVRLQPSTQAYHHLGLTFKAMATNVVRGKPATRRGGKRNQRRKQAIANRREEKEAERGTMQEPEDSAQKRDSTEKMDVTCTVDASKADGASGGRHPMELDDMSDALSKTLFDNVKRAEPGAYDERTTSFSKKGQAPPGTDRSGVRQEGSERHGSLSKMENNQQRAKLPMMCEGGSAHDEQRREPSQVPRHGANEQEGYPPASRSAVRSLDSGFSSMPASEEQGAQSLEAMEVHCDGEEAQEEVSEESAEMMDEEELQSYGKPDLVIDMAELKMAKDIATASKDSKMLRRLMRAIKSPPNKKVTTFTEGRKFVAEAIEQLQKAIEFSEKENTRAMYDLGLLYKALNQSEKALDVFDEIYNRENSTGPLDVIGAYEQSGLILLDQSQLCDDEKMKADMQKDAEDKLNKALRASVKFYLRLPLVGVETTRVWHSVATLLKIAEQTDPKDQKLKDKLKILRMTRNPRQILPLVDEVMEQADQNEDFDGFKLCIESLVNLQKYGSAIPIIEMLRHKSERLDPELVATTYFKAAEGQLLNNTDTAAAEAREYFASAFREIIARGSSGPESEGAPISDSMSSDLEGDNGESWDVLLLHEEAEEDARGATLKLEEVLHEHCGLRVTYMQDDCTPGSFRHTEMGRIIMRSQVIIIVLDEGRNISNELNLDLNVAVGRPRVFVLTLREDSDIPTSLKPVEGKRKVSRFPAALLTDIKTGSVTQETASAISDLFCFIGGFSGLPTASV